MNFKQDFKLAGRYSIKKYKVGTNELVQELGPFTNEITDIGLERVGTDVAMSYCYAGSGTTPASTSDTSMGNLLEATFTVMDDSGRNRELSSPYWNEQSITYRFDPPGSNINITEVGVGWTSDSAAGLWSRALTVDEDNDPVTITVLADEYLDVTYTLRMYPELGDESYTVTISGVDYDFDARQSYVTSIATVNVGEAMTGSHRLDVYAGPTELGPVTDALIDSTAAVVGPIVTASAYVPSSLKATYTALLGTSEGNVTGGITGFNLYALGPSLLMACTQVKVRPAIPKINTYALTITFEKSWARV